MNKILHTKLNEYKSGVLQKGFNELTIEMDKHRLYIEEEEPYASWAVTYLQEPTLVEGFNGKLVICIRMPGATRGHVELDKDNVILDVVVYNEYHNGKDVPNTADGYHLSVRDAVKKFIGYKIVIDSNEFDTDENRGEN